MLDGSMIRRTSNRLQGWNYAAAAAYFVTIVVRDRACIFGEIIEGAMVVNRFGSIVVDSWHWLSEQYDHVELDAYIVMPNHLHGIVVITEDDGCPNVKAGIVEADDSKPNLPRRKPLGRLIGAFKTVSTKQINQLRSTPDESVWQRGFYDRIIRNEAEFEAVREYILGNPAKWEEDAENPSITPLPADHV